MLFIDGPQVKFITNRHWAQNLRLN